MNEHIEERIRRSEAEADTKFVRLDSKLDILISSVTEIKEQSIRTETKVSNLKFWLFGAAIGVIGVVGSFMTYGVSMLRLGLSQ